ncbi:Vacuolar protein sorting-associated protein 52 [Parelaphostrongylus tenuis]|uniref:Vacuolar protein sorting-associated protein 52 homolog n=1 Tax=Parelaphostrongylus tenuis TaxID=148309 RepID=A0AAD5QXM4_PARTN|nr:Vacuolar protein sorting-associated protein 52 [Parelaphostrongylus tenuis]
MLIVPPFVNVSRMPIKLADLHNQIVACDQVFERLEKMLLGFQDDLGTISQDMKRLQDESVSINQELDNRQKVRSELSQFVDDIIVPQNMIKIIMETDVNDRSFLEQLHELQHKINFVKAQEFKDARSVYDVLGVLESLKFKAIEKIREWILTKIYMFRKPLSNYQIPQHQLLKCRFFYEFLAGNEANIAQEVQEEYVDTISKMFFSYFKVYITRLFKLLMTDAASKDDLLGTEHSAKSGGISALFAAKPQHRNRATVFSLGSRQQILTHDFLNPLIVPHAAQEANQKFQFEALFRSIHLAFVDHCSHEFLFLTDFFMVSGQTAIDLHAKVMGRAMAHMVRAFDEKIAMNFDCISLHLCLCLCDKFHRLLTERETPSMSGYWEAISNQLWTRLAQVMQMHNDSVKGIDVRHMQTPIDTRPHYIVRRYAELTSGFLVVTETNGREIGKRMEAILESCEDAVEQLLLRMSSCLSSPRDRLVFLINNYDLILSIIDERVVQESRIHSIIRELEQKAIGEFVEVTLQPHFSQLLTFVTECEPLVQQGHTQLLVRYNDKLTAVIQSFSANWRRSIDMINGEVVKSFTNFKNGTNILQAVFTQLVQYVQRFSKLVSHEIFRDNPARNDMVNIHHILVELKKYKPVY